MIIHKITMSIMSHILLLMMVIQPSLFFFDWIKTLEDYFEWYNFDDDECMCYASLKLVGSTKVFGN